MTSLHFAQRQTEELRTPNQQRARALRRSTTPPLLPKAARRLPPRPPTTPAKVRRRLAQWSPRETATQRGPLR